jgi:pimeloyl-ACP methyl ester carboxylesterase
VVPARYRRALPDPLFLLAGGPGQGARSYARLAVRGFSEINRRRDIVLVDLRGTGGFSRLECPAASLDPLTQLGAETGLSFDAADCLARLGEDPRNFGAVEQVADLEAVRRALGSPRINLWGGSYGTRTALWYARAFPAAVRTVVLDGAAPPEVRFPSSVPFDGQAALDRLLTDCAAEVPCSSAFPGAPRALRNLAGTARSGTGRTAADGSPYGFGAPRPSHPGWPRTGAAGRPLRAGAGEPDPVVSRSRRSRRLRPGRGAGGSGCRVVDRDDGARLNPHDPLLGADGAGKTTTLRLLTGLLRSDAGVARIDGLEVARAPESALARLGVLPDAAGLYPHLSVREQLEYAGRLHGLAGPRLTGRIDGLLAELGLVQLAARCGPCCGAWPTRAGQSSSRAISSRRWPSFATAW